MAAKDNSKKKATGKDKGGAMANNPKSAYDPLKGLNRVSPGIYKDPKGNKYNSKGQQIDKNNRVMHGPDKRAIYFNPRPTKPTVPTTGGPATDGSAGQGPTTPPTASDKFVGQKPEDQAGDISGAGGGAAMNYWDYLNKINPNDPYANAEVGFQNSIDRAYTQVMNRFDQTNRAEFDRQNAEFNQRMLEQGIDPNSGAYQNQYRALADAQNRARQDAEFQASQQAYAVAGQAAKQQNEWIAGLEKAAELGQISWQQVYEARQKAADAEKARQNALEQARISAGATLGSSRIQAESNAYVAGLDALKNQGNQNQQPNPVNTAIGSGVGGAGAAIIKNTTGGQ